MSQSPDFSTVMQPRLPDFDVRITPPDLAPWVAGNIGLPGFTSLRGPEPGPHVALMALTHGNEFAGAIVLDRLLRQGFRPLRGTLTLGFANLAAFARFDIDQPTASRFVDEDLNRVWDREVLDGQRESSELMRARQMRPLIETVDVLLDLHSMLWPSDPLLLCGTTAKGLALARRIPAPGLVVADHGHVSGRRLIDYGRFNEDDQPGVANLVEAGQHWQPDAVAMTEFAARSLLHAMGLVASPAGPAPDSGPRQVAEVSHTITAATSSFAFMQSFRGGDVIERRNTLIALDGSIEIRTPYDNCLLVMPSLRPSRGHTAVRLARFIAEPE
jgi:predicted deacylase